MNVNLPEKKKINKGKKNMLQDLLLIELYEAADWSKALVILTFNITHALNFNPQSTGPV